MDRALVFSSCGGICACCGKKLRLGYNATMEHVIPKSLGGDNSNDNCILLCQDCNRHRGNKKIDIFDYYSHLPVKRFSSLVNYLDSEGLLSNYIGDRIASPDSLIAEYKDIRASRANRKSLSLDVNISVTDVISVLRKMYNDTVPVISNINMVEVYCVTERLKNFSAAMYDYLVRRISKYNMSISANEGIRDWADDIEGIDENDFVDGDGNPVDNDDYEFLDDVLDDEDDDIDYDEYEDDDSVESSTSDESCKSFADISNVFTSSVESDRPSFNKLLNSSESLMDIMPISSVSEIEVARRTGNKCAHCGVEYDSASHIIHYLLPTRLDGESCTVNSVLLCDDCFDRYIDVVHFDLKLEFPYLKKKERIKSMKYMEQRLNRSNTRKSR